MHLVHASATGARRAHATGGGGFTLVEIMVALGVFALVAVSAYGRMGSIVDQQGTLETRTLATWVAQNRITAIELEESEAGALPAPGEREDRVTLGGRNWTVRTRITQAPAAGLVRLDVAVFAAGEGAGDRPAAITLQRDVGPQ